MLVNYDNEYVGAKAWNRLCAVRDWATSIRKAAEPPKPPHLVLGTSRGRTGEACRHTGHSARE
jgi:hypothetical protein